MTVHPYCVDPSHWHVYPVPDFICVPGAGGQREPDDAERAEVRRVVQEELAKVFATVAERSAYTR